MDFVGLAINLASGLAGGNIAGAAWKEMSLGTIGNTIAGLIGGVAGGYIMHAVGLLNTVGLGDMAIGSLIGNVGSAGVGGAVLTIIAGMIKKAMTKA